MNFIKKNKSVLLGLVTASLLVGIGESAIASRPKTIQLVIDNEVQEIETSSKTIKEALEDRGFNINDIRIDKEDLELNIKNNLQVSLDTKKNVSFNNKGTLINISTFTNTVEEFLHENNIKFDEDDNVSPSLDTKIKNKSQIVYDEINVENYSKEEEIKFETNKEFSFDLEYGKEEVKVEGKNGKKKLDYTKVTKNDEVVSDELTKETILLEPTTKNVLVGTKEVVEETIEPNVVEKSNDSMFKGQTKVVESGSAGKAKVIYENDGTNRKEISREVLKEATDRIVEYGTKSAPASSSGQYSLGDLQFRGIIYWGGKKFTYYSQSVLPGYGLNIPGRHVNSGGFVADGDGYIVLAGNRGLGRGTVVDTPFGGKGKIYDICASCSMDWLDVYTR